jgi:hypothetical protein
MFLCRFAPHRLLPMVHELAIQRPEEALHTGVVPTVACVAYAGRDAMRGEHLLVQPRGLLNHAIGLMKEFGVELSSDERHAECLLG